MQNENNMKTLTLALLLIAAVCAQAQPTHLEKVYRQYNNENAPIGVDPVALLNVTFSSKKISTLHCLLLDGTKTPNAAREIHDLEHAVRDDHFEEWISIRKGKGRVAAYSLNGPGDIKDWVCLLVGSDDAALFFHLRGHFTPEDKARLEAALQDHEGQ
jgi:hypothetical protein